MSMPLVSMPPMAMWPMLIPLMSISPTICRVLSGRRWRCTLRPARSLLSSESVRSLLKFSLSGGEAAPECTAKVASCAVCWGVRFWRIAVPGWSNRASMIARSDGEMITEFTISSRS